MNEITKSLVPAVVSCVEEAGGYVTKTKLLKLLYLLDVEFYRAHGDTLTGFDWKFFHLGPWTGEFDPLIDALIESGSLVAHTATKPDYDTTFYHASEPTDFGKLFRTAADEFSLKNVLRTWADSTTGEILNHVYFNTEPMERGVRNERLDFTSIPQQPKERYTRPASGVHPNEIRRGRTEFDKKISATRAPAFDFTPPRYDDEFTKGIAKLDRTES